MIKLFIKNRKHQKVAIVVEEVSNQKGLAFVMHGLGGYKDQPHIRTIAKAFFDNGYTVVTFDTTNTFGESEGLFDDATVTNYYEDLEDVIEWTKTQKWYEEPFCLAGHSLGGICTALYAENYPEQVKALAPTATIVSGKLSLEKEGDYEIWKKVGYKEKISRSKGISGKLKWSHMEDRLKYDLVPKANLLTMPVLMMVGSGDTSTPLKHQQILFDVLLGPKELHIITGSEHTFREPHLREVYNLFDKWITKI